MKLKQIHEDAIAQLAQSLHGKNFFNRPFTHLQYLYQPEAGSDAGSRTAGYSYLTTGIPIKPRHRHYLGFEKRLGAIRL